MRFKDSQPSKLTTININRGLINTCIGAIYTWLLLMPFFKDAQNLKSSCLTTTMKILILIAHSKDENVKDYASTVINNLLHLYGRVNLGKDSPFLGSIYINSKANSDKKLQQS